MPPPAGKAAPSMAALPLFACVWSAFSADDKDAGGNVFAGIISERGDLIVWTCSKSEKMPAGRRGMAVGTAFVRFRSGPGGQRDGQR